VQEICTYCQKNDIHLFKHNPYYILSHVKDSCALVAVATDFPELSWAEAFSASKVISNGTGWRIGAMVGSVDFIRDIATIKGNTDSGFVAPMAVGVLNSMENAKVNVAACRELYKRRIAILIDITTRHGMTLAIEPGAGFFTLWRRPDKAFGESIKDAEYFNY